MYPNRTLLLISCRKDDLIVLGLLNEYGFGSKGYVYGVGVVKDEEEKDAKAVFCTMARPRLAPRLNSINGRLP